MPQALVTGASRGLGRTLTHELVRRGWDIVVDARDADALHRAEVTFEGSGSVTALVGDVTDRGHREALAEAIDKAGLDLLVNNASHLGPSPQPTLDRYPIDEFERVYEVNVIAPLALVQATLPQLRAAAGTVVNITSDAAVEPYEGWGGYGSSKAALDQLTAILGAEEQSLHVYAFDPGDMRTVMQQEAFPGEDISDRPEPETVVPSLLRLIVERPPSGRYRVGDLSTATVGAGR